MLEFSLSLIELYLRVLSFRYLGLQWTLFSSGSMLCKELACHALSIPLITMKMPR
jgi:hypothetical protein